MSSLAKEQEHLHQPDEVQEVSHVREVLDDRTEKPDGQVSKMALKWHDVFNPNLIDLVTEGKGGETGQKIGQAEFELLTKPDLIQTTNIELKNKDMKTAAGMREDIDQPSAPAEMQHRMTEDHVMAMLAVLFRNFNERFGGQVLRAKNLTFFEGEMVDMPKSTKSSSEATRNIYNFVIPPDGKDEMQAMLAQSIHVSFDDPGMQFDVDPIYGNFLGNKGFSYQLKVIDCYGNEEIFDISFYYGQIVEGENDSIMASDVDSTEGETTEVSLSEEDANILEEISKIHFQSKGNLEVATIKVMEYLQKNDQEISSELENYIAKSGVDKHLQSLLKKVVLDMKDKSRVDKAA